MRDVIVSDAAKGELRLINDYLSTFSVKTASSFVDEVENKINMLQEGVVEFPIAHQPNLAEAGYRAVLVKSYVMLYRTLADGSAFVAHVFHQSQDYAVIVAGRD